jgi:hypothetical protein
MLKWPWSKQANESNHFMYTNACLLASKQAFVLVCVYLEVNSFNLQNYGKIITCENFKGRTLFDVSPIKTLFH